METKIVSKNVKAIKVFLNVSYEQKNRAKSLGCKWDADKRLWYFTHYPKKNDKELKTVTNEFNVNTKLIPIEIKPKKCKLCNKSIVPIGSSRENGKKTHSDWDGRDFHKKCFLINSISKEII